MLLKQNMSEFGSPAALRSSANEIVRGLVVTILPFVYAHKWLSHRFRVGCRPGLVSGNVFPFGFVLLRGWWRLFILRCDLFVFGRKRIFRRLHHLDLVIPRLGPRSHDSCRCSNGQVKKQNVVGNWNCRWTVFSRKEEGAASFLGPPSLTPASALVARLQSNP